MDTSDFETSLWNAPLRRADFAEDVLAGRHAGIDGRSRALLKMADGSRPLRALAAWLGLTRAEAIEIAEPLLMRGLMEVALATPREAELDSDPLPAHLRAAVAALQPVVAQFFGSEAAGTIEADARQCRGEFELLMRMRARLPDARQRDAFFEAAAAALAESRDPVHG
jgi:hypothetical protein